MSLLTDLQQEAAARLAAQAFFSDAGNPSPRPVGVLTEQIGSLPARVAQSLGQLGVVCVVLTPTARTVHPNYPRPYFDEINLVARTQENVTLNRANTGHGSAREPRRGSGGVVPARVRAGRPRAARCG